MKGCAWIVLGIIIGAALLGIGIIGWTMLVPLSTPPQAMPPVTGEPDIAVNISESYLNRRIAQELTRHEMAGLAQVLADVQPERLVSIVVEGKVGLGSLELFPKGTIVTQLNAGGDGPTLSVVRLEVAGVHIPKELLPGPARQIVELVEAEVNATISAAIEREGLRIWRTETTERAITVELVAE